MERWEFQKRARRSEDKNKRPMSMMRVHEDSMEQRSEDESKRPV